MSQASPTVSPMRWSSPWCVGAKALAASEVPVTAAAASDHAARRLVVDLSSRVRSARPPNRGTAASAA